LGLSGKIIRILRNLYQNAATKVRLDGGLSSSIDITEGLMQGEVLSPLLFSMYVSEIEKILIDSGIAGVKISASLILQILLFADDMVLMAGTPQQLQRKINLLKSYFEKLGLKVNLSKTKVMVFRKGGRVKAGLHFTYGQDSIEIVNQYTYLGVPFSCSGVFSKAAQHFKRKGISALAAVWKVIIGGKVSSWHSKYTLFRSISCSSSLYASHLWGLNYMDILEDVQQYFYKKLLGFSRTVPRYLVRLECGVPHMKLHVIKQAILYIIKLYCMGEDRYAKKCVSSLPLL
jgi:hypothetical protein